MRRTLLLHFQHFNIIKMAANISRRPTRIMRGDNDIFTLIFPVVDDDDTNIAITRNQSEQLNAVTAMSLKFEEPDIDVAPREPKDFIKSVEFLPPLCPLPREQKRGSFTDPCDTFNRHHNRYYGDLVVDVRNHADIDAKTDNYVKTRTRPWNTRVQQQALSVCKGMAHNSLSSMEKDAAQYMPNTITCFRRCIQHVGIDLPCIRTIPFAPVDEHRRIDVTNVSSCGHFDSNYQMPVPFSGHIQQHAISDTQHVGIRLKRLLRITTELPLSPIVCVKRDLEHYMIGDLADICVEYLRTTQVSSVIPTTTTQQGMYDTTSGKSIIVCKKTMKHTHIRGRSSNCIVPLFATTEVLHERCNSFFIDVDAQVAYVEVRMEDSRYAHVYVQCITGYNPNDCHITLAHCEKSLSSSGRTHRATFLHAQRDRIDDISAREMKITKRVRIIIWANSLVVGRPIYVTCGTRRTFIGDRDITDSSNRINHMYSAYDPV